MTSRDAILQRIRTELSKGPKVDMPPVPEVWPRTPTPPAKLAERFAEELQAVQGEVLRAATMDEARRTFAELADKENWTSIGTLDRPLCHELTAGLAAGRVVEPCDWTPPQMAQLSVGLITPEHLLADTGSSVIACGTAPERLLCYLPPACVVIARLDQLVEHLPAAWERLAPRVADPAARGEFVIITGPSRTADIEKVLILGVHGPKRLIVILVG